MIRFPAILFVLVLGLRAEDAVTRLKPDERIIFYPIVAKRVVDQTNLWRTEIRGCVFEPEKRGLIMAAAREALDLKDVELTAAEEKVFRERARLFLTDHERGKTVFVRFSTNEFLVGKSGADGSFGAEVILHDADLNRAGPEAGVPFEAVLTADDSRTFSGEVFPLADEGVSVVSDIDDTIKITEVRDKKATLRSTFLREFQPVPGMAELYRNLAKSNHAAFHYVSASPWQLYEPLAEFVTTHGFPEGTFELKEFRWKDRSFFSLFGDPEKYKAGVIEPLLRQFPRRRFMLIGDSGERDPEIYGALARKFPQQITRICIRDVTNESGDSVRYKKAFREVPPDRWQIFREPGEVNLLPEVDPDAGR